MTEQQFLIALLREMATGSKPEDIQKFVLDRMETLEKERSSNTIKTYNEFKQKYLPNDTSHIAEKYISPASICEHDWNYAWNGTTPQPCRKCGKLCDGYTVTYSVPTSSSTITGLQPVDDILSNLGIKGLV